MAMCWLLVLSLWTDKDDSQTKSLVTTDFGDPLTFEHHHVKIRFCPLLWLMNKSVVVKFLVVRGISQPVYPPPQ